MVLTKRLSDITSTAAVATDTFIGVSAGNADVRRAGVSGDTINAKAFGAIGDGIADDTAALQAAIDAAFVVTTSNAQAPPIGNKVLYIPAGSYKTTSPLLLTGLFGGIMRGAGRFATQIINSAGSNVIQTQGCQYSRFEDFLLQTSGSAICYDLDWDGVNNCALQSNTFINISFGGGAYGVSIGASGAMGSENTFLNCFWSGCTTAGLATQNFNALQNQVIGGNFQSCGIGILVNVGSVPVITGTGFQSNTSWDISVVGGANDTYHVIGCRSESTNFANFARGNAMVSGCSQLSGSSGIFVQCATHNAGIYNSVSAAGQVGLSFGVVEGCEFGRADWATSGHFSLVRSTYIGGLIDSSGYVTFLFDGEWSAGVFYAIPCNDTGTLTDAATIATDASKHSVFTVTINGNRTLGNPTNMRNGDPVYRWIITQGAGGNHTLAYDTNFTWVDGTPGVLSTAAGAVDMITATYDGSKLRASIQKGFA
jgi:hypothetical protein